MSTKLNIGDLILYKQDIKIITNIKKINYKYHGDAIEYVILKSSQLGEQQGYRSLMWSFHIENELKWGSKIIKLYDL